MGLEGLESDLGMEILWEAVLAGLGSNGRRWSHLEATLENILAILKGLGADLYENGRHVKMSISLVFWPHFGVLGVWLEALGAHLGDLGVKSETFWQHVGTKMA